MAIKVVREIADLVKVDLVKDDLKMVVQEIADPNGVATVDGVLVEEVVVVSVHVALTRNRNRITFCDRKSSRRTVLSVVPAESTTFSFSCFHAREAESNASAFRLCQE